MKTLIKSLALALSLGIVTSATTFADSNPGHIYKTAAAYNTGVYSTKDGVLCVAVDKDQNGTVLVTLASEKGEAMFQQRVGKYEQKFRVKLNLSELPDGTYTLTITNGVYVKQQTVTLSTLKPVKTTPRVALGETVAMLK